ncbi:hypothetical protein CR513_09864, partial [Mucuna pruriens]
MVDGWNDVSSLCITGPLPNFSICSPRLISSRFPAYHRMLLNHWYSHYQFFFSKTILDAIYLTSDFLDEQLLQMNKITPWFADIYNFIIASKFPLEASKLYKENIESDAKYYI